MSALTLATIPDLPGAACVGADVDLWFAPEGEDPRSDAARRRIAGAKAVCAGCPAREACLSWAEEHPEEEGIWGGLTKSERDGGPSVPPPAPKQRKNAAPCGTLSAYTRHQRRGEVPCALCTEAKRLDSEARRRQAKRPRARKAKCGTPSGYNMHLRRKEQPCEECRAARREYERARQRPARKRPRAEPIERPECGTTAGWRLHRSKYERVCGRCLSTRREIGPAGQCGTYAGYSRHRRREETPCAACADARLVYSRDARRGQAVLA